MDNARAAFTKRVQSNFILIALVIVLFFLNFYSKTLFYRPSSIHQWRQTDCLSITKNFYEEGMIFFEPKIHYQGVKGGKAVSECPILNYTVACLWKVFGEHEFIYRLLEYIIFLAAIFLLYNTLLTFFSSTLLALISASIFLTSPLLAYYSLNFIADVPALSLGVISFCLFYKFYFHKTPRHFYLAILFGTLAVLMKASALIALSLLLFFSLIDLLNLNKFFKSEKLFVRKTGPALAVLFAVLVIFSWYRYALAYNNNNNNNIFLLTVLPIWEMDEKDLIYNLKILFNNLFPVFLNRPMFFLIFCLAAYVIAKFKELNALLKYAFVFSGLFFLGYLLFFFQVFGVHDYYLVNIMIFPVIIVFCFVSLASGYSFHTLNSRFLRIFFIGAFIFNAFHCAAVYRNRMVEDDKLVYWFPFLSEDEKKLGKYLFWDYGNGIKRVEHFTLFLRDAGIKREDHVLSIPDYSFDISLYLMDQKGYTIARDHMMHDSIVMGKFVNKVKYVILSDTTLKKERAFRRVEAQLEPFFVKNHVEVFRVKKAN